jgi:PAS domain S-box-containing protein
MSPSLQTAEVFGTPLADSMETKDDLAEPQQKNGDLSADFYVTRLIRAGVAAAFVVELAHLVLVLISRTAVGLTFGSHLLNVVAASATFALTWTTWYRRHWRALIFVFCTVLVASATLSNVVASRGTAPLFLVLALLLMGAGVFVSWGPRWQLFLLAVCGVAAVIDTALTPIADPLLGYRWLDLAAVGVLAQFVAIMAARYRMDASYRARSLAEDPAGLWKILEASPDMVTITRLSDGRYITVSNEFLKSGYTLAEAIDASERELGIWVDDKQRREYVDAVKTRGSVRNMEMLLRKKDASALPCLISGVVVDLAQGPSIVSVIRDVSRMKRAERDLVAAREAALAASRTKSDFISNMSHEIRTPMNAVLGMAELLAESDLSTEQRKYLSIMMSNGNALLELIDDVLDLAKIESGNLTLDATDFDLNDLAERVAETLSIRAHQKGLELAVYISPNVRTALVGDPMRLRQVLINLIGNAIKFTERGEVVLAIERANRGGRSEPGVLHFRVSDTGIGIPVDQRARIFASYAQGEASITRKYGGTGLGLAITRQLVDLMGGQIWVESEVVKGSTFHFTARFQLQHTAKAINEDGLRLNGIRALVTDDTEINRVALGETLASRGAAVAFAANGDEALQEIKRATASGAPYQIVLLDCRMPGMDGGEVARRITEGAPSATIVIPMLTSDDLNVRLPLLRRMGLLHNLIKPVRRSELFETIRAAMVAAGLTPQETPGYTPAIASTPASLEADASDDRPLHILLADDSADSRLLIEAFLKRTGYQIDEAENGEVALQKFFTGRYDVVIMDIQMPVMDGYTAVRRIREWERQCAARPTPIIALTASVLDEAVSKSIDAGCTTHVSKPVRRPILIDAIQEVTQTAAASRSDAAAPSPGPNDGADASDAFVTKSSPRGPRLPGEPE